MTVTALGSPVTATAFVIASEPSAGRRSVPHRSARHATYIVAAYVAGAAR
jgi:hypothetical protein